MFEVVEVNREGFEKSGAQESKASSPTPDPETGKSNCSENETCALFFSAWLSSEERQRDDFGKRKKKKRSGHSI